eukprot:4424942-Prymnesium_polylepis.1
MKDAPSAGGEGEAARPHSARAAGRGRADRGREGSRAPAARPFEARRGDEKDDYGGEEARGRDRKRINESALRKDGGAD